MLKRSTVVVIVAAMVLLPTGTAKAQMATSDEAKARRAGFNLLQVYDDIRTLEYEIKWQDSVDTLQTPNRAHNMRFSFYDDGFIAVPRDPNWNPDRASESWRATFLLESLGSKKSFSAPAKPNVKNVKNTVEYIFEDVAVNYTNDISGLQQTFLIKSKPAEAPLQLRIAVNSRESGDRDGCYRYICRLL